MDSQPGLDRPGDARGQEPDPQAEPRDQKPSSNPAADLNGQRAVTIPTTDTEVLDALRRGDEQAFLALVRGHHAAMVYLAMAYVEGREVAEEVVQETWLAVVQGLHRFEGRCPLKRWIFAILVNRARTRGEQERRTVSLPVGEDLIDGSGPALNLEHLLNSHYTKNSTNPGPPLAAAPRTPEKLLLDNETRGLLQAAVEALPPAQKAVVSLRDIEGWSSQEVREFLALSPENERVLLHRARMSVRRALAPHLRHAAGGKR